MLFRAQRVGVIGQKGGQNRRSVRDGLFTHRVFPERHLLLSYWRIDGWAGRVMLFHRMVMAGNITVRITLMGALLLAGVAWVQGERGEARS